MASNAVRCAALMFLGSLSVGFETFIYDGSPASKRQLPYQVSINLTDGFCGGTLIDRNHVLTAAHCLLHNPPLEVQLGSLRWQTLDEGGQKRGVEKVKMHPQFDFFRALNDIAVLKLDSPVDSTENIQPIALATSPAEGGLDCVMSGWGWMENEQHHKSDVLLFLDTETVTDEVCSEEVKKLNYGRGIDAETQVCAGDIGKGACSGDSGGPLACKIDGKAKLTGVVSWSPKKSKDDYHCGQSYTIFAEVPHHAEWIEQAKAEMED